MVIFLIPLIFEKFSTKFSTGVENSKIKIKFSEQKTACTAKKC